MHVHYTYIVYMSHSISNVGKPILSDKRNNTVCKVLQHSCGANLFFLSFSHNHHYLSTSFSPCTTHPLHKPHWRFMSIKTNNEVNLANVKTFLTDTSRYESVITTFTKLSNNLHHNSIILKMGTTYNTHRNCSCNINM